MKGSFCLNNSCANLIYHHTWLRIASFVPCRSTSRSIRCLGRQGFQIIFKEHNTQKQQNCSETKFILDRFSSSLAIFVKLHENSVTGKSNLFSSLKLKGKYEGKILRQFYVIRSFYNECIKIISNLIYLIIRLNDLIVLHMY